MNRWFRKTFNALSVREYRYLWLGSLFTFAGMQMSIIARGFLAYDLTGSNGALGAVTFGFAIPMLCLSLWGGVVADRVAKRRLLMIFQSTVALNSAWIATMVATDLIEFWMLIVSSVIQGVVFSFIGPARMAFTTDLIGKDRLANAIALQQLSMRSTQVVGPALAGVLIGVPLVGVAGLYYINTVAYIICVGLMFFLPRGEPHVRDEITSPLADLAAGLRYVQHHTSLKMLILTSFVVIALGYPYESFLPAIVEELFDKGPTAYGLMSSGIATGAIISTVVVAGLVDSPNAWRLQLGAALAVGGGLIALGFAPGFIIALVVVMPFLGAMSSGFQSLNASLAMVMTDDQYQGRVMSINMLSFGLFGFAALPIGLLADAIGLRQTFILLGVVLAALVVAINLSGAIAGVRNRRLQAATRAIAEGRRPVRRDV